jgi:hypothetical protein
MPLGKLEATPQVLEAGETRSLIPLLRVEQARGVGGSRCVPPSPTNESRGERGEYQRFQNKCEAPTAPRVSRHIFHRHIQLG